MSDSKEKPWMSTRSKTPDTGSNTTWVSPRTRAIVIGAGAVRSSNLEKTKDGSFIYRRRSSTGSGPSRASPAREKDPSPSGRKQAAGPIIAPPAEATTHKRMRTLHTNSTGEVVESDAFCWLCHKDGKGICCELCPRMYHLKCLSVQNVANDWVCPECEKILQAECADTRSKAMSLITLDQLCVLLKYSLQRMKHTESQDFHKPVDSSELKHYNDYIHNPMDLSSLEKNVRKKQYGSTEAFLADTKYILHNCIVFNGEKHKLTSSAKMVVKICKHEMNEIEICPDCYMNSCTKQQENWFCEPCRNPHTLVWAKMKGYPYWPAKALREVNGQFDVRFFGEHDRAWVTVGQVYLLSKEPPISVKKGRCGYEKSMEELELHIHRLVAKFGNFEYAPNKMFYDPNSTLKSKDTGKVTPRKTPVSSPASTPGSSKSRSPASTPDSRTTTPKSPDKPTSILCKTASAVKLKYSSIISTRHSKRKGLTIGDNVTLSSEDKTKNSEVDSSEPSPKKARLADEDIHFEDSVLEKMEQSLDETDAKLKNTEQMQEIVNDAHEKSQYDDSDVKSQDVDDKSSEQSTIEDNSMGVSMVKAQKLSIDSSKDMSLEESSLDKVFLLNEEINQEAKPKIDSPLDVIPKTKLPDKKIINSIENKIKLMCDDIEEETTAEQSKTDGEQSQNSDNSGGCEITEKNDENEFHEKTEKTVVDDDANQEVVSKVVKSAITSPVVIETNDDCSKTAEAWEELSETEPKKNLLLEKLVANCKEALGVDSSKQLSGDGESKSTSSENEESDDYSMSSAESAGEKALEKESAKDADDKEEPLTVTLNEEISDSGKGVPVLTHSEVPETTSKKDTPDDDQTSEVQLVETTPSNEAVPMEESTTPSANEKEALPTEESTPVDTSNVPENKTNDSFDDSEQDMLIDVGDSSNDSDTRKSTPEKTSKSCSPKVIDIVPIEIEETTTQEHLPAVDSSNKTSPGTVKVKPQAIVVQKPQTATILPEKVSAPQKSIIPDDAASTSPKKSNMQGDLMPEIDLNGLDLSQYTNKVMKSVQNTFQEFCSDMIRTEMGSVFRQHLQLEVKRLEWRHSQELNEIKHTANLKLLELRAAMELDKEKALDRMMRDLKFKCEREKKQAIEETKKKQWCGNCGKEAIFYCCWNTSYCDYPCQQSHWPEHMSSCTQSQNSQQSRDTPSTQSESTTSSTPINVDTWQQSNAQGPPANRMVPQVSPVLNSHAQPLYIGQSQRLPSPQIGGPVIQYIQPTSSAQQFQRNNPQQFQLGAMNQMHQPQPPLVMSIAGSAHQPQLRPMMNQNQVGPQSLILPQGARLPPTMMPGSLQYRPNNF